MAYDYVKRTYDFVPEVGRRVKHTVTGRSGEIRRENPSQCHYVMVRFDGQKHTLPCHPGELEYLAEAEAARADAFEAAAQIAEHLNGWGGPECAELADHIAKCIRLAAAVPMATNGPRK